MNEDRTVSGRTYTSLGVRMLMLVVVALVVASPAAAADDDPLQATYDIFTVEFMLFNEGGGNWSAVDIAEGTATNLVEYDRDSFPTTHQIVITGQDGEELWSRDLGISFEVHPYGGEHYERDKREFYWRVPYFQEASTIDMYELEAPDDPSTRKQVFSIDLEDEFCSLDGACPAFCDGKQVDVDCTCGDGTCQDHEDQELCGEDCGPGRTVDGGDGSDSGTGVDIAGGEDGVDIRFIAIIVIVVALIGMLLVYSWRHVEIEGVKEESA